MSNQQHTTTNFGWMSIADGTQASNVPSEFDRVIDEIDSTAGANFFGEQLGAGKIIPVASGVRPLDAVDPAGTQTPIQDAIDVVNAAAASGQGRILYPPEHIETPGGLTGAGNIDHIGMGIRATRLELTTTNNFLEADVKDDASYSFWDGIYFDANGASASAFHFTSAAQINFNIGTVGFGNFGSAPIIDCDGASPYGSTWRNVFAQSYGHSGPVLRANGTGMLGMDIGLIAAGSNDPTTPIIELLGASFGGRIGAINCGGASGKILHHHGRRFEAKGTRSESLDIGWINSEPNQAETAQYVVKLDADTPVRIRHITHSDALSLTGNVVQLDSYDDSGTVTGPGRKHIGTIHPNEFDPTGPFIDVLAAPSAPSWHWGPASNIDYGGFAESAVIPLEEVRAPTVSSTTATASGDGTATTFSLPHSLSTTPSAATIQPTSTDAAGDFHVSSKTASAVDVTYESAPVSGTDNLTFDLILDE